MTYQILLSLIGFAFVSSITPGPNNMMLMASGANFGLRRSVPHMLGVSLGHSFLIIVLGLGLVKVYEAFPTLQFIMKWGSIAYLLYLSYKIATAAPASPKQPETKGKPLTFLQAAAFQWVNPKGWMMTITAITNYTADETPMQVLVVALVFMCTNLPSITFWAGLGVQARRFLSTPARLRIFNVTMALLLVATIIPILTHH
ncbi:LysE family translocator [Marivivens donghaensis]|uniref:LysE family translocator n=1 Tax=Marivivens donghaensis TaxID=1699413 RepID=A0ABX0VY02_9RHOB|nr:LysE family translocator [Marivivens donghaensis]NIY72983.1 LysE family translocator [Marivivens donghaensis]